MRWTVVFLALLVSGVVAWAIGGIASLPECVTRADGGEWCSRAISDATYAFYQGVQNAGFAAAALGALGLLGRYTGLLRR